MAAGRKKHSLKGAFITFEGIDGCGKTTQARRLAKALRKMGVAVRETREPGGTPIGRALRKILLDPGNSRLAADAELLLYLADRTQHLTELIRPALKAGETVVCDRFHDATVAYQGSGRGLDLKRVAGRITAEIARCAPELTFWLDVSLEAAKRRMRKRGGSGADSRLDGEARAFHERVRRGYAVLHRENPRRIVRIDAARGEDEVAAAIWRELEKRYDV